MAGRWMDITTAAEYMGCSTATVRRHIEARVIDIHVTAQGLKRLDREQIDAMFTIPNRAAARPGVVTAEDERRYVTPKHLRKGYKPPKEGATCEAALSRK